MALPPELRKNAIERLDELIRRGEAIKVTEKWTEHDPSGWDTGGPSKFTEVPRDEFYEWRCSCLVMFERTLPDKPTFREWIAHTNQLSASPDGLLWIRTKLKAIRENLALGLLDDLGGQIESEIAASYMSQAEQLLGEAAAVAHGYVPAAVLAGAVLERFLRELCARQRPVIDTLKPDGKSKTLEPLIADLTKAGAFNATKAQVLRGWAAIRNRAAHGEWDQFKRADVEGMVRGVQVFVSGLQP